MSEPKHTPGPLEPVRDSYTDYAPDDGHEYHVRINGRNSGAVAYATGGGGRPCKTVKETQATAIRLASCYNACEGINPAAVPDLVAMLEQAVARVEIANEEGNPIMSAWLPEAAAALDKARELQP